MIFNWVPNFHTIGLQPTELTPSPEIVIVYLLGVERGGEGGGLDRNNSIKRNDHKETFSNIRRNSKKSNKMQ